MSDRQRRGCIFWFTLIVALVLAWITLFYFLMIYGVIEM
jgi:hypothetical protein